MTFLLPVSISEGGILNIRADVYMTKQRLIRDNAEEAPTTTTYFSSHRPLYKVCLATWPFQTAIAQSSLVILHPILGIYLPALTLSPNLSPAFASVDSSTRHWIVQLCKATAGSSVYGST
jgi:hypothetical protein